MGIGESRIRRCLSSELGARFGIVVGWRMRRVRARGISGLFPIPDLTGWLFPRDTLIYAPPPLGSQLCLVLVDARSCLYDVHVRVCIY